MTDVVYHYCSLGAFKGIVESKCLWASSFRYMNDASEAIVTQRALGENHDVVLRRIKNAECYGTIKKVLDHVCNMEKIEFFLASFCKQPDKLSQWRYYADGGRGVCLGFSKRALSPYLLKDVLYGDLESRVADTCDALVRGFKADDEMFRTHCIRSFIELVGLVKSRAFIEEDECRLIHFYDRHDKHLKFKFRQAGKFIVPYIEIDLASVWDQCLTEVWLGPMISEDLVWQSINFFLQKNDVQGVMISESRAPLRQP
jgi:hypothetical protein